jgi:hypothetical protein
MAFEIKATTTNDQINAAIPFLDMREHAKEQRDYALAVLAEQGDETVLELHKIDGVTVLWSPVFAYAYVNEQSLGVGNSFTLDNDEAPTPELAAQQWKQKGAPG